MFASSMPTAIQQQSKTISSATDKEIAVKKTPATSRKKRVVKKEEPELEYEVF
jgi:hypothetical protein